MAIAPALLLIVAALFQVVQPDRSVLPAVRCTIAAVDAFGTPLPAFEVKVDGKIPQMEDSRISVQQGKHIVEVSARGFNSVTQTIDFTEATQRLVFCLPLGAPWDKVANPVSIALEGKADTVASCKDVFVSPLFCSLSRKVSMHQMFNGRLRIADLEPGSYVLSILAGKRSCAHERVEVGQPNQQIIVKVN